ncbi:DUF6946 family protein [Thiocapsa marina]|uniref:DUF6946 domain-containing protein n=1 Tax=Thiocapsa marina 5811 TaxID=768671 RepID=F9UAF4_9GAMM|nr:hypothetical protein [Thiocapsa marina]EGV19102.1 hypothetical protein ThimaDRAFT_1906 [Thiocapsa marina 5811]
MSIAKAGQRIASLADWEQYAPPKSPRHWVDGRSAKEVARAWLEGGGITMPQEVLAMLSGHPRFDGLLSWDAEPEARLRFDAFPGEPRNSDLLVIADDSFGPYLLAVEAKADETYGDTLADVLAAALEQRIENPRSNRIARIDGLATLLLRPRCAGQPKAGDLRYQLFTACAGALAEAHRRRSARAIMLVHEFITSATSDVKHARNASDLRSFLSRISGQGETLLHDGELQGPFVFPPYAGVELFVGKVARNLR